MPDFDYTARVIADSLSEDMDRVTTLEVTYPRFVHSELMTHRWFSRNAASSRAIPVAKSLERVLNTPSYPVHWGAEQKGMQSGEELTEAQLAQVQSIWEAAKLDALDHAEALTQYGLHKSLVNRILEPWLWITVVLTATDWENFLKQRATSRTPLAQPELARAADLIEEALAKSTPTIVPAGGWHLPYWSDQGGHPSDVHDAEAMCDDNSEVFKEIAREVSTARCARVSLLSQAGVRDLSADRSLYGHLITASPMHASPLEHPCTPNPHNKVEVNVWDFRLSIPRIIGTRTVPALGNLLGWSQLRHMVEESRG